ncbi:hypothetical protein MNBD_GAMMA16-526 [hydrothermal vent metagenome]|uniref:Sulfotransferase domain-containing protein n=1 Tax=hydrothermal vent metagenome TaxID=652676 RepID=A0A3B0ZE94_9ZZZZ
MKRDIDKKWGTANLTHDPVCLANFKPRPTDILITTAPKAGTTWMQQILYQLHTRGNVEFKFINEVVPWLELPRKNSNTEERLTYYETLENPRIFKTHCTYPQTPGSHIVQLILSSRDPRDCCVSFYHHIMDMTDEAIKEANIERPASFDEYFERWIAHGSWFRNIESWWPHKDDSNLLWLRYQDMKQDLPKTLNSILSFLQWQCTPQEMEKILHYTSFEWMKAHSEKFSNQINYNTVGFKPGGFIRKGKVGDYKTLLKPEQESTILDKAAATLPRDCLDFLEL